MSADTPAASSAEAALSEARAAMRRNDLPAAMDAARRTIAIDPGLVEAWHVLGNAAQAGNDFETAEAAFTEGASRAPAYTPTQAQMYVLRARALMSAGRPGEAVRSVRQAVKIGIPDATGLTMAGVFLLHAGLSGEAKTLLEKAVKLNPRYADAWYNLGSVNLFLGDTPGAQEAYEKAIALGKAEGRSFVPAHHALARLKRWTREENHIERLEALQCRDHNEARTVGFALFKEYDDIGDTEAAWDALQHGAMIAKSLETWTTEDEAAIIQAWKTHLPPERLRIADTRPRSGPKRIFVVGLPRSGTTLVERILAAHSQVQAVGELKVFGTTVKRLAGTPAQVMLDAETAAAAMALDPLDIAEAYSRESAHLWDGHSAWTLDKMPQNHDYTGLIKLAFPDAIIVALDRNPMDALWGSHKLLFNGAHGWSYSLDDLAEHYHHFRQLMAYWKVCLGDDLIDVSLEGLIADPDMQIRRLIAATGLPFEEACLSPHEATGAVATASTLQVRKPINAEGIGAWKRYEHQLEPLRKRLSEMGYL